MTALISDWRSYFSGDAATALMAPVSAADSVATALFLSNGTVRPAPVPAAAPTMASGPRQCWTSAAMGSVGSAAITVLRALAS